MHRTQIVPKQGAAAVPDTAVATATVATTPTAVIPATAAATAIASPCTLQDGAASTRWHWIG